MAAARIALFDPALARQALADSLRKLSPRVQFRNPVMFVVLAGSVLTTLIGLQKLFAPAGAESAGFVLGISAWLWFTLVFANFAEAIAEGRGKAQAASLRGTRRDVMAKKLDDPAKREAWAKVAGSTLRKGDFVLVEAGDTVPGDGEAIEGAATVNEAAITGESAPVIREAGGDRSSVTGGRACSPTGSWCASPPTRARPSSTA
jgi:K+-transporting ATPase ATPase B chain